MVEGLRFEPRLARVLWGVIGGAALAAPVAFVLPGVAPRVLLVVLAAAAGGAFASAVWDVGMKRASAFGVAWGGMLGAAAAFQDMRLLPLLATWGAVLGAGLAKALTMFEDAVERRLLRAEMVATEAPRARWGNGRRRPAE